MELFTDLTNIIRAYTYTCVRIGHVYVRVCMCDACTEYRKHCPVSESPILREESGLVCNRKLKKSR